MRKILVCGSIAFDNIMSFDGYLKDNIIPEKIDSLNVSFLVNNLKKARGGVAPNISYNLALVGLNPIMVGSVGKDFSEYGNWLKSNGVNTDLIQIIDDDYTASCFITTDLSNNQISSFYAGAMLNDINISLKDFDLSNISMVIISPTLPEAMIKWALECQELNIPYLADIGMQIPRLSKEDLLKCISGATILVVNEYEFDMLVEKTELSESQIIDMVELVVRTLGEKGSILYKRDKKVFVPSAKPNKVVNPTGAGDAYRAGLLKGYFENQSLDVIGKYGSVSAAYAVENFGGTEHKYTIDEFYKRYKENFE